MRAHPNKSEVKKRTKTEKEIRNWRSEDLFMEAFLFLKKSVAVLPECTSSRPGSGSFYNCACESISEESSLNGENDDSIKVKMVLLKAFQGPLGNQRLLAGHVFI